MKSCNKCVLTEGYPGLTFDKDGVCSKCTEVKTYVEKKTISEKFTEEELKSYLTKYKNLKGKYDVLVPISGGVDSSVALINLVEKYNLRPLAFHNDHGYEDEIATNNVKKLCKKLDVDLIIWQHDLKFMKKLWKYVNESNVAGLSVCYLCGNILYLNGLELAEKFDIPLIINGYSKGQIELINNKEKANKLLGEIIEVFTEIGDREFLNEFVRKYEMLNRQKVLSNIEDIKTNVDLNKISFIPYFMFEFNKTDKEALKKICKDKFDWQPMNLTYPARTTNCEMIWLNTYFDLKKKNYSVYTEEYATLVRKGEITREQALSDLSFNPPEGLLERLSSDIDIELNLDFTKSRKKNKYMETVEEVEFEF